MKKYFRAAIYIGFTLIKFCLIKLFHMKCFNFSLINLVSPLTEVEINKGAKLYLGKMLRANSGVRIRVRRDALIQIGNYCAFSYRCLITCHQKIIIGNNVQFGPNVLVYDHDHDFRIESGLKKSHYKTSEVTIGNNVWIGANTIILRGTNIGDNCVIGAGSVIKGSYPENSVIVQKRQEIIKQIME